MSPLQPHAQLDFPRLALGDDRHRRFEVIHGRRETVIKVHGDAMADINAEASALKLHEDAELRRLALLTAPSPRHTREEAARRVAEARARQQADREATAAARRWYHDQLTRDLAARSARLVVEGETRRGHPSIPRTGPARIATRARRDRLWTLGLGTAAASCLGLLGVLAYLWSR